MSREERVNNQEAGRGETWLLRSASFQRRGKRLSTQGDVLSCAEKGGRENITWTRRRRDSFNK